MLNPESTAGQVRAIIDNEIVPEDERLRLMVERLIKRLKQLETYDDFPKAIPKEGAAIYTQKIEES